MKQKTIGIYQNSICQIGGVETFLYNWCLELRNYYDITVLYYGADPIQLKRLARLVKTTQMSKKEEYIFDIVIRNSVWGDIPDNITSKENRYLEMRHANYKYLLDKGVLYNQYHKWNKTNEIIACGEYVGKMSDLVLKDNPYVIKNILAPKKETSKILNLISCTRIDPEKGWNRMLQLAKMLRGANIKFDWKIFTNNPQRCEYEEIHFYKQTFDIFDYVANADYTILLSDSEGLSYTIQESLQYQTPCIVTDVGGNVELIQDGINGYVVPLDMNFDVTKLLTIPKCKEYDNGALEKWLDYLGDSFYIEKEMNKEVKHKVRATKEYVKRNVTDSELGFIPQEGYEWEVTEERLEVLTKIVKYVEDLDAIEEPKKEEKKITKKATKKK